MIKFIKTIIASALGFFVAQSFMFFMIIAMVTSMLSPTVVKKISSSQNSEDEKSRFLFFTPMGSLPDKVSFESLDWLSSFDSLFSEKPMGLWQVTQAIKQASKDPKILGIYMNLSYLNTNWSQANQLIRTLEVFKKSKKKLYVYADHYSEVSYLVATTGDRIFTNPLGSFELNGLGTSSVYLRDLFKKLDFTPIIYRRGQFKSATEMFTESKMSQQNRKQIKGLIAGVWQEYVVQVSRRRPQISSSQVNYWAQHLSVSTAEEALKEKLVDQLAQASEVKEFIQKEQGLLSTDDAFEDFGKESLSVYMKKNKWPPGKILLSSESKDDDKDKIALLFLEGQIGGASDEGISLPRVLKQLKEIKKDENVKALVVRINSPGGSAFDSDVIWAELRRLDKTMPVVVSLGAVAASGGYYIASGGRHIFTEPTTITGSIGVFGIQFYTKEFFNKKLGVQFDSVVTHPFADMGASYRKPLPRERQVIEKEMDKIYNKFKQAILTTRPLKMPSLEAVAQGRVWTGTQAVKLKLADTIGGMEEAILWAKTEAKLTDYEVKEWPKSFGDMEFYIDLFEGSILRVIGQKFGFGNSILSGLGGQILYNMDAATKPWFSTKLFNYQSKSANYYTLLPRSFLIR